MNQGLLLLQLTNTLTSIKPEEMNDSQLIMLCMLLNDGIAECLKEIQNRNNVNLDRKQL